MSKLAFIVLFCFLNVLITLAPHATSQQCQSNGSDSPPYDPTGTLATLTLKNFGKSGYGGAKSKCDGKYHPLPEKVVALSTGWYDNKSRCGKLIKIMANGRTAYATVVDECDSVNGCDQEHAYQPPCRTNIVDASQAVWDDLGLISYDGLSQMHDLEVNVIWTMA